MAIPSYQTWKTKTNLGAFHTRSKLLKKVDEKLEAYWTSGQSVGAKGVLRTALNDWLDSKDDRYTSRNKDGIVDDLIADLLPYRVVASGWTAPSLPTVPVAGQTYLAQSFEYSNSLARANVPEAIDRARKLIDAAYRGIVQARSPGPNRDIYELWFGAYDANRFSTVFNTVKALYDALFMKPVLLYYRGAGVTGPSDCPAENEDLTPGGFFGAAWQPKHLPPVLDRNYTYIFLGTAFFTSGVYAQDSTGGVIIHELSHSICGTDDVVYKGQQTYGPALCQQLAAEKPQLAVFNADSYEYLSENYQNKLFQPKALNLNLPTKASISLQARLPV